LGALAAHDPETYEPDCVWRDRREEIDLRRLLLERGRSATCREAKWLAKERGCFWKESAFTFGLGVCGCLHEERQHSQGYLFFENSGFFIFKNFEILRF
jgi:hypothetical protein